MKTEQKMKKRIWFYLGILLTVCLLGGLLFAGWSVWTSYRTAIMNVQKEQMLNTVDSIAASLEHEMKNYMDDVQQLAHSSDYGEANDNLEYVAYSFSQYLAGENGFADAATLKNQNGDVIAGASTHNFTNIYDMCSMGDGITLSERMDEENQLYFVFTKQTNSGMQVEIDVSVRDYYENLVSNIKIGTNGYIVLKTSGGTILMHPEEEQWGLDVIEGREKLYGVKGLDSLGNMIDQQLAGESGVSEYDSYWWGEKETPKVRKISAYTPATIGDDFFVVSSVIDYDDIFKPIINGFVRIGIIFFGLFLLLLVFLGVFTYLAFQKKKNQEEIEYLKNLNQVLEETRKSEEVITHQQRLQIMGTMTGGIAHEFNNMLTPIMGYADMLLDMLPPESAESDFVQEIFDASERAKDVIQQISSLSRKNMETVFTFIQVKRFLSRTMKMVHSVCPVNVKVQLDEAFGQDGFLGNETQMKQVILNLCVNAFHAIGKEKDGCITIWGRVEKRQDIEMLQKIQLANEWDEYITIRISDNGCGMNTETMEQIFTPFFTTKKTGKGTGLGLSVAEQIIHTHKGYVCVTSKVGIGSSFYLYLPCVQEGKISERTRIESLRTKQKCVLIVDDNEKILQLLRKEFERIKIEVHTVETPEEAKEALQKKAYSLMLIDRTLAENYSGVNFAMSIQNQYPDVQKLLMVDQVQKEVIEALQQKLIDGYIEKPVSATSIIEKLREINHEDAL